MTKSSNQFIKNTILKLLGAIGSEKEINKYIEKFSSPEQRFAVIKVGGSVVENDLENLISSLVFLNQVGLKPVILHGAGPMLSKVLEEKKIDFSLDIIKKYYLHESKRWDLEVVNKIIIKLPVENYIKSLKNFMYLMNEKNFEEFKLFDYRVNNQLILK